VSALSPKLRAATPDCARVHTRLAVLARIDLDLRLSVPSPPGPAAPLGVELSAPQCYKDRLIDLYALRHIVAWETARECFAREGCHAFWSV